MATLAQLRRGYHRRAQSDPMFHYEEAHAPYFYDRREEALRWRPEDTGADLFCFPIGPDERRIFPLIVNQCGAPRRPVGWIAFEVSESGAWCEVILSEGDGEALSALSAVEANLREVDAIMAALAAEDAALTAECEDSEVEALLNRASEEG